ncbi:MAG: 6,7-dimethyl-8-ribityllumazine synthase [Candidatus Levybacteria bacterium]|nr:6,7-dimethyl-8-ribityllumazine synthase [Candidatus Levybacteria bacterium]
MLKKHEKELHIQSINPEVVRVAIIRTDYHKELNDNLQKHAVQTLLKAGVKEENMQVFSAPGAWEIPYVVHAAAKSKKFDAIITFGVIVKGETYHFEMIANECARALMQISIDYSIPVAIEILAVFKKEQAEMRASDNDMNKGIEGAVAVLKALDVSNQIHKK